MRNLVLKKGSLPKFTILATQAYWTVTRCDTMHPHLLYKEGLLLLHTILSSYATVIVKLSEGLSLNTPTPCDPQNSFVGDAVLLSLDAVVYAAARGRM